MHIEIVDARPEHIEGAQEVFYRAWLHTYPNEAVGVTVADIEDRFKSRHEPERIQKRQRDVATLGSDKKYLIALDGTQVVGVCRAEKSDKENRLNAIYILPEYQGQGIGTLLWRGLQSFFDPTKNILVGVATYNDKAISFYKKLGFRDTGRRYTDERLELASGANIPQMDMIIEAQR